jgi:hypothetical protein
MEIYDFTTKTCHGDGLWPRNPRAALSRFHYHRDRLFWIACSLYALNRWVLKPRIHSHFLHDYFNDLLLIPCALPLLLASQRWVGLRSHDQLPTMGEISLYLVVWSILFEVIGPHIMPGTVGDPLDVVAYTFGALFSAVWWHRRRLWPSVASHEL